MKRTLVATVAALAVLPSVAAAQTTYSDRATFTAAAGSLATETFSGCGTTTSSFSGPLSSSSGPCTGILPGVTYTPASGNLYIAGPGQSGNPTTALGLDFFAGDPITISFGQTFSSFGADLFQNFVGGQQSGMNAPFSIGFFSGATNVATYNLSVAPSTGSFFGISGSAFDRVTIAQNDGYAVIDNLSFGGGSAVPETGTWSMLLLGFGGIGYAMRRRPKGRTNLSLA